MKKRGIWGTLHPFFEAGPVFGRMSANAGFLTALLQADPFAAYHFFIRNQGAREHLEQTLRRMFPTLVENRRVALAPVDSLPAALARDNYACFHLSDWVNEFVDLTLLRNVYSKTLFPVTAPVHTLSYARYGAAFLKHLWPGASRRERIIATSRATEEVVAAFFAQLRSGYGLSEEAFPAPGVSRIPLGIDPGQFPAPEEKRALGAALRQELGLADKVVFLSFSRISYVSKMDFLPILDAFIRARKYGLAPESCHFVLAGRMRRDDPFGQVITNLARDAGVGFTLLLFPDTPDDEKRKALFAAADVFLSPVDNIQETFGLTILEAFASSLPVIASAIDGYKDLVEHGKTGFLIRTVGPASAEDSNTLAPLAHSDLYHLYLAQQCVVEPDPFARSLAALGQHSELRREMGRHARQTLLTRYSWPVVLEQYLRLWDECAALPLPQAEEKRIREAKHPAIPDFMRIFSGYFCNTADDPVLRRRLVRVSERGAGLGKGTPLVVYSLIEHRINLKTLEQLLQAAENPVPFAVLADCFARPGRQYDRDFLLLWALKHDLLEFVS